MVSGKEPRHRLQYSDDPLYFHEQGDGCKEAALALWRKRGGSIRYITPDNRE
jgi:hypothetical protein